MKLVYTPKCPKIFTYICKQGMKVWKMTNMDTPCYTGYSNGNYGTVSSHFLQMSVELRAEYVNL